MKRAAGQIRKARKNKGGGGDKDQGSLDGSGSNHNNNNHHDHHHHQVQQQQPVRRKPTPEEAALTAKNYRLAKELSDLRVRHREENKNVSRLTMENMNLASQWRNAVNHITMLKKELAIQQHRTAEAMAQQKALAQRQMEMSESPRSRGSLPQSEASLNTSPNSSFDRLSPGQTSVTQQGGGAGTTLQEVAAEMDRMDRILAAHQSQSGSTNLSTPPPPPPPPPRQKTSFDESSAGRSSVSPAISNESFGQMEETSSEEKKSQSMEQPVTPSPEKGDDEFDNHNDNEQEGVHFFASFDETKTSRVVDLDDEIDDDMDDVDDPPLQHLSPANSVSPSESPPPSPPPSESPDFQDDDDYDDDEDEAMSGDEDDNASPLFPMTASPVLNRSKVYNEGFPEDITPDIMNHPRSAERRTAPDFKDIEEESSAITSTTSAETMGSRSARSAPPPPLSSVDAFEASFATKFPESFSPSEDKLNSPEPIDEEYNPFFPSPQKEEKTDDDDINNNSNNKLQIDVSSRSLPPSNAGSSRRGRGQADNSPSPVYNGRPRVSTPNGLFRSNSSPIGSGSKGSTTNHSRSPSADTAKATPTGNKRFSLGSGSSMDDSSANRETDVLSPETPVRYQTPPHGYRSPESIASEEPKRPEKAGAAAARARYEKALQPRFSGNAHRFPRRAEREVEPGASPVAPKSASKPENNAPWVNNTSKLAMAQALVKERAASFSGKSTLPTQNGRRASYNGNQWAPRPSPTDSVGSKPWDEDIGDIPMSPSPRKSNEPSSTNNVTNGHRTNGVNGVSPMSRTNGINGVSPMSTNSPSSNARRLIERNRPWDRSSPKQETPAASSDGMSSFAEQNGESESANHDFPSSSFIAAGKSRRRVKQPISYAEPSLSAKVRQGHVFFPKDHKDARSTVNL